MSLRHLINHWVLSGREAILCRRLIRAKSPEHLLALLRFAKEKNRRLPFTKVTLRETIFALSPWELEEGYQNQLFLLVEDYLFKNVGTASALEWQLWLSAATSAKRRIDVMSPGGSASIKVAIQTKKLNEAPRTDYEHLLGCFRVSYEDILDSIPLEERARALPLLLELGILGQILGLSDTSRELLRRWASQKKIRPRTLSSLQPTEAFLAPISGLGSPNGVSVTIYHSPDSHLPVRITCAGNTGDPFLDSQIFTCLFAAALASDQEPTFVMSAGATLSFAAGDRDIDISNPPSLAAAVIGPGGPVQPDPNVPAVGMSPDEALVLTTEMLEGFKESTGLVQMPHWTIAEAQELEKWIRRDLAEQKTQIKRIPSDPASSETGNIIHMLPYLHRDDDGTVVPIQIEIPYEVLGPSRLYNLLRQARQSYMQQLVAAARRREAMARKAYDEQNRAISRWQALSEEQKELESKKRPHVTINQRYNFELGVILPVDPPKKVPLRSYEDTDRPQIRDSAKQYRERFSALCAKLQMLNQEGGKADVLTFKLLVDSIVRQGKLWVENEKFQTEYQELAESCSIVIWAKIEDWAINRGLSPDLLAADNVFFNAKLNVDENSLVLEPWVALDLHDFVIEIDSARGLMEVRPAGRTQTLVDKLVTHSPPKVEDRAQLLVELHRSFCECLNSNLHLNDGGKEECDLATAEIYSDRRLAALLRLQQAKNLLFKGQSTKAAKVLELARSSDLAAIYFWGAVANQYHFLQAHFAARLNLKRLKDEERKSRLINIAISTLITHLRKKQGGRDEVRINLESGSVLNVSGIPNLAAYLQRGVPHASEDVPVDPQALSYLEQLQAKDTRFVAGLLKENPDILALETKSLNLSLEDEKRFHAAVSALLSLELMQLAESMNKIADKLPFAGTGISEAQHNISEIVTMANSISLGTPLCIDQITDLRSLIGMSRN